eukprot:15453112-Alexandrium_andersonii.AAC.1
MSTSVSTLFSRVASVAFVVRLRAPCVFLQSYRSSGARGPTFPVSPVARSLRRQPQGAGRLGRRRGGELVSSLCKSSASTT